MKIYKKSLLYGALAFTLCMAGGCNSNIDLEPEGIITADGYFKSAEDYEKALTALYERLNVESYDLWMDGVTDNGLVTHSWSRGYDLGLLFCRFLLVCTRCKGGNGGYSCQRIEQV